MNLFNYREVSYEEIKNGEITFDRSKHLFIDYFIDIYKDQFVNNEGEFTDRFYDFVENNYSDTIINIPIPTIGNFYGYNETIEKRKGYKFYFKIENIFVLNDGVPLLDENKRELDLILLKVTEIELGESIFEDKSLRLVLEKKYITIDYFYSLELNNLGDIFPKDSCLVEIFKVLN